MKSKHSDGKSISLQWRHNDYDGVSIHQPHGCLLKRLFGRRSKKTPKLRVTGLCVGNSPGTSEFPAQMASNAENASIWWRHHVPKGYVVPIIMTSSSLASGILKSPVDFPQSSHVRGLWISS